MISQKKQKQIEKLEFEIQVCKKYGWSSAKKRIAEAQQKIESLKH